MAAKKILFLVGDFVEDYEIMVPFQMLLMVGHHCHAVCPGKKSSESVAAVLASTSPARKRFLREARSAAAIRHDNVVAIHAVEEQPIPYLVMEYIPGRTLQRLLDEHGPLDVADALRLSQQIASGLAAAHSQGLIHRDIKPSNILLENDIQWKVKISDFGLARAADDASVTQSGTIAGTPMYMSPEQAHSNHIDQRSDLFSFGSVLYQMISGRPPFRAATTLAVLKRVTEDTARPIQEIIPEVPDWLCTIISKLHSKRAEDRYQTASEVADLLACCQSELQHTGKVTCVQSSGQSSDHAPRDQPSAVAPSPQNRPHPEPSPSSTATLKSSSRGAMTATLGNSESSGRPGRRWWRYFGVGTIVALVLYAAFMLNRGNNKPAPLASGGPQQSEELTAEFENLKSQISNTSADPDRRAAEYVLSIGGTINIMESGQEREINVAADLPHGAFELTVVNLNGNPKVTGAGLAHFKGCTNLMWLGLLQTAVTDAGLSHFRDCKKLMYLSLNSTQGERCGVGLLQELQEPHAP